MALRGLKITLVCIAILFISCSIILSFKFKNTKFWLFPKKIPFVSTFQETDVIKKKHRIVFVEQGIVVTIHHNHYMFHPGISPVLRL